MHRYVNQQFSTIIPMNIKNWNISFEVDADFGSKCSPYIRKNIIGLGTIPKLSNAPDKCEIENAKENPYKSGDFHQVTLHISVI